MVNFKQLNNSRPLRIEDGVKASMGGISLPNFLNVNYMS